MTTTQTQKRQAAAPSGLTATPVVGGGTFTAGAKFWKITAVTPLGESAASAEATATIALNGSATLAWTTLPPGTSGVNIYRGTATGAENALIATLSGGALGFTDTGAAGGAAAPPANTAWGAASKTAAGLPTKANVPAGTPAGPGNGMYAGLVGWAGQPNGGTGQARNRKYVLAAGYDVQEV